MLMVWRPPRSTEPTGLQQLKTDRFNLWKTITLSTLQGYSYCQQQTILQATALAAVQSTGCHLINVIDSGSPINLPNQASSHIMKSNILKINIDDHAGRSWHQIFNRTSLTFTSNIKGLSPHFGFPSYNNRTLPQNGNTL